jgi:hypothetical protein
MRPTNDTFFRWSCGVHYNLDNENHLKMLEMHFMVLQVKEALFAGGIARSNRETVPLHTPGIRAWSDLVSNQHIKKVYAHHSVFVNLYENLH